MSNAFAPLQQARPCPTLGRPVRLRVAPIDYSPAVLRMPFGFRLATDTLPSGRLQAQRLQVPLGCIRLSPSCPCRVLHTFSTLPANEDYPRFWISRSSSERERDFNPPEQYAAQRTVGFIHSPGPIRIAEMAPHSLVQNRSIRENPTSNGGMIDAQTTFCHHLFQIAITE